MPQQTYDSGGLSILVIDDDPVMLRLMEAMLRTDRHRVGLVNDSSEALTKFANGTWDVVLTDYNMPGKDGEQISQEVKKLSPQTAVVLMTGFSRDITFVTVDAMVHKPFKPNTIAAAINRALGVVRGGPKDAKP